MPRRSPPRITKRDGVAYTGLWLNTRGLERALATQLDVIGAIRVTASEQFAIHNTGMDLAADARRAAGVADPLPRRRRADQVGLRDDRLRVQLPGRGAGRPTSVPGSPRSSTLAEEFDIELDSVFLADTVGFAGPAAIERVIGAVRERWPDLALGLHLHDTRGLGVANAYTALRLGVDRFDSTCAGLGGCPFAGHEGAAGNVCSEELIFLCEELGIDHRRRPRGADRVRPPRRSRSSATRCLASSPAAAACARCASGPASA